MSLTNLAGLTPRIPAGEDSPEAAGAEEAGVAAVAAEDSVDSEVVALEGEVPVEVINILIFKIKILPLQS